MNIEDKVDRYMEKYVGEWTDRQEKALIKLLKEQDRDTRHACAEAVNSIDNDDMDPHTLNTISECHDACMNTRAV